MSVYQNIFVTYILAINLLAYILMCYDKYMAKNKGWRIPENTLFFIAFILGAIGIYLGMNAPIYHKAAKSKFKFGIPLIIVLNLWFIYFICKKYL